MLQEKSTDQAVVTPGVPAARSFVSRVPEQTPIVLFLIGLMLFFTLSNSNFATVDNWSLLLSNIAAFGLIAIGQTLVIICGGFDLSVAGVAPLAAVLYAKMTNDSWGMGPALIVLLVLGGLVGTINGFLVTRFRINPLITTLATLSITGGMAYVISNGQGIAFLNPDAGKLGEPLIGGLTATVLVWVALIAIGHVLLRYSLIGRSLYCVGGNSEASWLAGLPVRTVSIGAYAACSMLAALGGIAIASQLLAGEGGLASNAALTSVAAVVLGGGSLSGGRGGMLGTLIGVLILGVLANGLVLLQVNSFYQQIVTGAVLLLAVGMGRLPYLNRNSIRR
jgi:ribose transport system permease protein